MTNQVKEMISLIVERYEYNFTLNTVEADLTAYYKRHGMSTTGQPTRMQIMRHLLIMQKKGLLERVGKCRPKETNAYATGDVVIYRRIPPTP